MKRFFRWGTVSLTSITGDSPTLLHLFGGLGQESQAVPNRRLSEESNLPGDSGSGQEMDDANQELETRTESIYD
jgi:hypothetical protein